MKLYLIEYIDPRTDCPTSIKMLAEDKTAARDLFFTTYPNVVNVNRITWIPTPEQ